MQPIEQPAMEAFLLKHVPKLADEWKGASTDQLEELKELVGRPLPAFYEWFLSKMGRSGGAVSGKKRDLSITSMLSAYRQRVVVPDDRHLMIGSESDDIMPMQIFYDLERQVRQDAMVVTRPAGGAGFADGYETLGEMLAVAVFWRHRLPRCAQICDGVFTHDSQAVLPLVDSVFDGLGFERPLVTGTYCGIFERDDAAMACRATPADEHNNRIYFTLGAPSGPAIRSLLGVIASETDLEVEIQSWTPTL